MPDDPSEEVTGLLLDASRRPELLALVYQQLRAIAQQRMAAERAGHTLQATALVHEAYLRLLGSRSIEWTSRAHFFHAAAEAMRRILIEHARARHRIKRGGGGVDAPRIDPINVIDLATDTDPDTILSLDEALSRLEQADGELGEIVRLRFFAGLSLEEVAAATGLSTATIKRRWAFARAWLKNELGNVEG